MIALTLDEIAAVVGGRVMDADPGAVVTGTVEFDSRRVTEGGLFLALPGERVDGHDYVGAAHARGSLASLVTRPVDGPAIEVDDGFAALADLAREVLRRLPELTVVGVTGSSGKTSTKDLIAQVLARLGPTVAPPGSFNNELGHPYTVLRATRDTRFLVLEKSARGIGHIRYLTEIAPPRIGIVLNVGSAHLGEFGTQEAIAQAKGELVEALPADGLAVLNADDPRVAAMARRTPARVVTVGRAADADVRAADIELDDLGRASFVLHAGGAAYPVRLALSGAHHVGNALAAAAVALECGMPPADVAAALGAATAVSAHRMAVSERTDGVVVIDDAYNANPESVAAALDALAIIAGRRGARAFAVLGEMAELGPDAAGAHEQIGEHAARLGVARVIAVGEQARPIEHGAALERSWVGESGWVPDADGAVSLLRDELRPGDVVLVKASHAAALERVALAISQDGPVGDQDGHEDEHHDEDGGGST